MNDTDQSNYASPWGPGIKPKNEAVLAECGIEERYQPEQYIFRQGDPGSGYLYYLRSGMINIITISGNGDEKTIYMLEEGSFFGEATFFQGNNHFASALTLKECVILKLDENCVRQLVEGDSDFSFYLMRVLSQKLRKLSSQIEDLSFLSMHGRLSRLLLKFVEDFGIETEEGIVLPLSITDEQLGKLIGARREAITKALGRLRERGLLIKQNRKICVKDIELLREYVETCS